MIVWLVALGFAAVVALLMLRGVPGDNAVRAAVATALLAALGGYALTGRPDLPTAPATPAHSDAASASAFETERQARLSRFGEPAAWLTFADAMLRAGESELAVRGLRQIVAERPRDAELWIGLGNALAMHGGRVGAAARLAFDRAAQLAPASPHPAFFLGLAQFETGDARGAAATWTALRRRALPDPDLDARIAEARRRGAAS